MQIRRTLATLAVSTAMLVPMQIVAHADETPAPGAVTQTTTAAEVSVAGGGNVQLGATGHLVGSFHTNASVPVWGEVWLPTQGRWSNTARIKSSSTGGFDLPLNHRIGVAGTAKWRVAAQLADGTVVRTNEVAVTRASTLAVQGPGKLRTGQDGTISGTFTGTGYRARAEVWVPAQNRWSATPAVAINSGKFSIPLTYQKDAQGDRRWRVVVVHGTGATLASDPFTVTRTQGPTLNQPAPKPQGMTAKLTGKFPTSKAMTVWGEVWVASQKRWSRTPATTTTANGSYSITMTYQPNVVATTKWRVGGKYADGTTEYTRQVNFQRTARASVENPGSIPTGVRSSLSGKVSTTQSVQVWGEVWVPAQKRWSRTPARWSSAKGTYSIPLEYQMGKAGTTTWRVGVKHRDGAVEHTRQVKLVRTAAPDVDRRCLTGRVMCASKRTNKMHWMIDGKIIETVDVRFGRVGLQTREGQFKVFRKSRHHVSSIYGSAMPWAMFFSGGQAVHYSQDFATRGQVGGSAGCINVADAKAIDRIYKQVRIGDKVVVYR